MATYSITYPAKRGAASAGRIDILMEVCYMRPLDVACLSTAQGTTKRYKAYKPWAKGVASKPRPKDPLKPRKRRKAEAAAEQDLALQIRHVSLVLHRLQWY